MEVSGQYHDPRRFTPEERAPQYPLDRWLCGLQIRSGRCGEERNLTHTRKQTPAVQPVASRYTDWAILALIINNVVMRKPMKVITITIIIIIQTFSRIRNGKFHKCSCCFIPLCLFCLCEWNGMGNTELAFMKCYTDFVDRFQFWLRQDKSNGHFASRFKRISERVSRVIRMCM
jgi:hypothetical protein